MPFLDVQILDSVCSSWSADTVLVLDQGCLCPSAFAIILYNWGLFDAEKKENKQKPQTKKPQRNKKKSLFPEEEQK